MFSYLFTDSTQASRRHIKASLFLLQYMLYYNTVTQNPFPPSHCQQSKQKEEKRIIVNYEKA